MKGFNLSAWGLQHRALLIFLMLVSVLGGVASFRQLGRSEDPHFDVIQMTVTLAWPGASARQVQDLALDPIERRLQALEGVDHIETFARQGYGAITLVMQGSLKGAPLREAWYQARKRIGDMRDALPEGVRGPFVNDELGDVYSVLYALRGDDLAPAELKELADQVKLDLQGVAGVNKVDLFGVQAEQLVVEFSSRRLAQLGVSPQTLIDALRGRLTLEPAGSLDTPVDRVHVRVDPELHTAQALRELPVTVGGSVLRLGDLASVHADFEDPASFKVRRQGHPVIAIGVTMSPNGNVLQLGQTLQVRLKAIQQRLPAGVTLNQYANQPQVVADSVWEFERSFLEALAIVMMVSLLALGLRVGVVVAVSVPLVLGVVAMLMHAMGWNLDRISLGALIIALGLLVDDAIIAVEMMVVKVEEGLERLQAASFAWTSTAWPMLTGTLVTVAGFMPVGFARSLAGQYAGGIFWVVGIALLSSWLVAVLFTPYLGVLLLPRRLEQAGTHAPYETPLYHRLRAVVERAMQWRWAVILLTVALLLAALGGMALVRQQFFPTASRPELLVDLSLREGASFVATDQAAKALEQVLARDPDVLDDVAYVGEGSPRFYLSLDQALPNPAYAQLVLQTGGIPQREAVRRRLQALFQNDARFAGLRGRVERLEFGPPVGFAVQFRVIGPDADQVRSIAAQVRAVMAASPMVRAPELQWNEQVRTLDVQVDQRRARLLGLHDSDIRQTLQAALAGIPVSTVRRGQENIAVVLRSVPDERRAMARLSELQLFTRGGQAVPLSQVATLQPAFEDAVLWRRDRQISLSVRADPRDGIEGPDASAAIQRDLAPLIRILPPDYRIEAGGAVEESDKANTALYAVFPLMIVVMLGLLMLQLQSFARVLLVFGTAPLGLIGVVPALLVTGSPFGFVALLGVIALAGIIMRNSVILVDQVEHEIAAGRAPWQAVREATVRRARPVVLTAAAAVLAMIPLTDSAFWGPMAFAIMGGLLAATALTLLFVPALYCAFFRVPRTPE